MSTEILQPFQLDSNGNIATTTSPDVQTDQHLLTLVSTQPGERIMLPNYGVPSFGTLFSMDTVTNQQSFLNDVKSAANVWEPGLNVAVSFNPTDNAATMDVEIDWISQNPLSNSSSGITTATVLVGGTVVVDQ